MTTSAIERPTQPDPRTVPMSVRAIRTWYWGPGGPPKYTPSPSIGSHEISSGAVLSVTDPVMERARRYGDLPLLGTPEWAALPPNDPRAVGAIYQAASLWAVHRAVQQDAAVEASHDVSGALDWPAEARYQRDEAEFYAAHPYLLRRKDDHA